MSSRFLLVLAIVCCAFVFVRCSKTNELPSMLRINIYTEPPTLDPRKTTDTTSANVLLMLHEGLTRMGPDNHPHPALAKKIEISDDQRIYTFTLRRAYWSNGDRIRAQDFVYTWSQILDSQFPAPMADKLYPIKNAQEVRSGQLPANMLGIRAVDDDTLQVTLNHPTPYFLEMTAFPTYYPVNPRIDQKYPQWFADAGPNYVSTGPFRLTKWDHENEIIVEKNPLYWDAENVKIDGLKLSMIDDSATEYYMFEMDELDWAGSPISNLSPDLVPELRKQGKVTTNSASAVYYYKINTEVYPLHNDKIRRALAYAINREEITTHILQGGQTPATALVPPMPGWEAMSLFDDFDKTRAQEFFAEGLREEGLTLQNFPTLTLSYNANREHEKIAQAIQHNWKEVLGIRVKLEKSDWKVYLSKIDRMDYEIARMGWIGDFYDPVSFLTPFKYRDDPKLGGNNSTGWEDPAYTDLLTQADRETNQKKRTALLREAEAKLIEAMPVIPIFFITQSYLKKPYVKGVHVSALGYADFKKAYIAP